MTTSRQPSDRRGPSIGAYAFAHFGKSLWWNGSELFLAFFLTEHLHLPPLVAGTAIAVGLMAGAGFDLLVGDRLSRFASVMQMGRLQFAGASLSVLALLLLGFAFATIQDARLLVVVGANIVYRLAYALYDLPQNCLLSLSDWTPDRRRRAVAARTAAGAVALLLMAALVSIDRPSSPGQAHAAIAALASAIALFSAGRLWWGSRSMPADARLPSQAHAPAPVWRWPLGLMALVCLTSPAFSKLAPYLNSYSPEAGVQMPLMLIGLATVASQPGWIALLRRLGEVRAGMVAALLMIAAAFTINMLWLAALLVGVAGGGFGTVIWSGFAIAVSGQSPFAAAPAFARLTAIAKIALAMAAIGLGAILSAADYRHGGAGLLPFMRGLLLGSGVVTGLFLVLIALIRRGRPAGSG